MKSAAAIIEIDVSLISDFCDRTYIARMETQSIKTVERPAPCMLARREFH